MLVTLADLAKLMNIEPGDTILVKGEAYRVDFQYNLQELKPKQNWMFEFYSVKSITWLLDKEYEFVLEGEFK